jgi:hypothetical protein
VETRENKETRVIRKLLLVAAATAMPMGLIAATGGMASAATAPVNATTATVKCTGITGTAKFSPAVTTDETAGSGTVTIKASLTGCTTSDKVKVTGAKVAGVLKTTRTAGENGCTALAGNSAAVGNLTTTWTTTPKLVTPTSTIAVKSIAGSIGSDGNATFAIPGSTPNGKPSGSFQGANHGAKDATAAQTTTAATSILSTCESKTGLKSIGIKSPASGPAVSLS